MPTVTKVLTAADLARRSATAGLDLAPYRDLVRTVLADGVGATVTLGPGEQQRTEKRRLSLAAKELGYQLVWRKAATDQLRFVLAKSGERAPGSRQRRPRVEQEAEQVAINAIMTEPIAELTQTVAPAEASPPPPAPPAARRGRKRSA